MATTVIAVYRYNEHPAIWLRDHKGSSPHNTVTSPCSPRQGQALRQLRAVGLTRNIRDLKGAGAPRSNEIAAFSPRLAIKHQTPLCPNIKHLPGPAEQQAIKGVFTEAY